MMHPPVPALDYPMRQIFAQLETSGFLRLRVARWRELVGLPSCGFGAFAKSWDSLEPDHWMGDSGTYRSRRFATFAVDDGGPVRKPHQPHHQRRRHNHLNGGIDRWFAPVEPAIADHPITRALLALGSTLARRLIDEIEPLWHAEMHQFRIVADAAQRASPTPEGLHRDGVTGVMMVLIGRDNVMGGVTGLRDAERRPIAQIELATSFEMLFVDDRRMLHEVTPIQAWDPGKLAVRDALVLTFREEPPRHAEGALTSREM